MDAIERVTKVLRGTLPDRVPVGLHCYLMACRMHGGRFDEILRDGALMAEAQLNMWRRFQHDVIMLENGVCAAAEALGCAIRYTHDGPPHVEEPLIKKRDDLEKLRLPDPERTFPLNQLLKTTRIVRRETGGKAFINGRSDQGPVALASALAGPERFLTMLMDPELENWCQSLLAFCSRVNVAIGEAQLRAGADSSTIGLAGASLISPALFKKFELPGARAYCAALQRVGGFAFVHACGHETIMLENLLATGADCLELDPETDAETCKRLVQGRASVLGMIDPARVMRFGTPQTVQQQTKAHAGCHGAGREIYHWAGLRLAGRYARRKRASADGMRLFSRRLWRGWTTAGRISPIGEITMNESPRVALLMIPFAGYDRGLLEGIARYAQLHGPWVFFLSGEYPEVPFPASDSLSGNFIGQEYMSSAATGVSLPNLRKWGVNGLIGRIQSQKMAERLLATGLPVIGIDLPEEQFSRGKRLPRVSEILADSHKAGRLAAEHFLERGFWNFAFCGYEGRVWSQRRREGFAARLAEADFSCQVYRPPQRKHGLSWKRECPWSRRG